MVSDGLIVVVPGPLIRSMSATLAGGFFRMGPAPLLVFFAVIEHEDDARAGPMRAFSMEAIA
jgi:hypothetical protein